MAEPLTDEGERGRERERESSQRLNERKQTLRLGVDRRTKS